VIHDTLSGVCKQLSVVVQFQGVSAMRSKILVLEHISAELNRGFPILGD
jgi:hypothetical protein